MRCGSVAGTFYVFDVRPPPRTGPGTASEMSMEPTQGRELVDKTCLVCGHFNK